MIFGAIFAPELASQIIGDIVVLSILIPWFLIRKSTIAGSLLLLYQFIAIIVNLYTMSSTDADKWSALIVHVGLRAIAIFYLSGILIARLRERPNRTRQLRGTDGGMVDLERLEKLNLLREKGILTTEEFEMQKAEVLRKGLRP